MRMSNAMVRGLKAGKRRLGATALLCAMLAACGGNPAEVKTDSTPMAAPASGTARLSPNAAHTLGNPTQLELVNRRCDEALKGANAAREALYGVADITPAEHVLQHFNRMFAALEDASGLVAVFAAMAPDKGVREAAEGCEQRVAKFQSEVGLDPRLYAALNSAQAGTVSLDAATQRFFARLVRDFKRAGVDKDAATRARLTAINARFVELSQAYERRVREDRRSVAADPAQLAGLPEDWRAAHAPGADGKVQVSTDYPDYFPVQKYATDEALRRDLTVAFLNKGYPQNGETLLELLKLRHEFAGLLGFKNWADYTAQDKMVGSANNAAEFIDEVAAVVRPVSDADLKVLLARKKQDRADAQAVQAWDRAYYPNLVRAEKFAFDGQSVRPYFPFEAVKQGLFDVYAELLGVEFKPVPEMEVWHPSVEGWALLVDGKEVGRFYLDLHPRDGKYGHAAVFPMVTGVTGEGGTKVRQPLATLVCNFPEPTVDAAGKVVNPALMEHLEVVTIFHEFGHLIHHLLANRSAWLPQGGITVEWDFAEVPSQILEEWAWDPDVLARFAKHVETGAPIPADLVKRMRAAEEFGKGLFNQRQVFLAAYSHYLHTADPATLNLDTFTAEMYRRFSPFPAVPEAHDYANFAHLVGYSSMYYTYQWSLVIAKDLFTRFKANGLMHGPTALDYRQKVLEQGGGRDAADMVKDFLGRPYNLDAYKAWMTSAPE